MSELTKEEVELIEDMFLEYCDRGPVNYEWKSQELEEAIEKASKILKLEKGK